jgi:hypothetical protein
MVNLKLALHLPDLFLARRQAPIGEIDLGFAGKQVQQSSPVLGSPKEIHSRRGLARAVPSLVRHSKPRISTTGLP